MKLQNHQYEARHLLKSLSLPVFMLLGGLGTAGAAQAETCSPLQVASLIPINERVIKEGNRPSAVSFQLSATVKNTNQSVAYIGNNKTDVGLSAYDTDRKRQLSESHKMPTHIAPGGSQRIITDRIVVKRKNNRTAMTAQFHGAVANFQCQGIKKTIVSTSDFNYDLTPILTGGKAKRLSGRIRGASEVTPPPSRSEVPRPRTTSRSSGSGSAWFSQISRPKSGAATNHGTSTRRNGG